MIRRWQKLDPSSLGECEILSYKIHLKNTNKTTTIKAVKNLIFLYERSNMPNAKHKKFYGTEMSSLQNSENSNCLNRMEKNIRRNESIYLITLLCRLQNTLFEVLFKRTRLNAYQVGKMQSPSIIICRNRNEYDYRYEKKLFSHFICDSMRENDEN